MIFSDHGNIFPMVIPCKAVLLGCIFTTFSVSSFYHGRAAAITHTVAGRSRPSRNVRQNTKICSRKVHGVNGEYFVLGAILYYNQLTFALTLTWLSNPCLPMLL